MKLTKEKIIELTSLIKHINSPEFQATKNDMPDLEGEINSLNAAISEHYIEIPYCEKRIDDFNETLLEYAQHDYSRQNYMDYENDLFDSLALSINFLGEELNHSTITKEYLEDIFNSMSDMLIVVDKNHIITSVNNATTKALKYSNEDIINKPISTIFPNVTELKNTVINYEAGIYPKHYALTSKHRKIPILKNVSSFVRGDNQEIGSIIIARDISILLDYQKKIELNNADLIKSKEDAENANKLKSLFLANLSHEIRTPMNVIIGFSELLETSNFDQPKREKFTGIIRQSAKDLLNIINDLLEISKIESGQLSTIPTEGKISDFTTEVFNYFNEYRQINGKNTIEIYRNIQLENIETVYLDFDKLRQIFINLIGNAFKFTEKGHIEFGCKMKDSQTLLFYVTDTGIGIPEDKKEIIFMPFRQVEESLSRKYGGTGLGLSISKGLAEIMGGEMWFESTEKEGSTFYFTLPYNPVDKPIIEDTEILSEYNWKDKQILVVEDNVFNTEYLLDLLIPTGIKCFLADDGESAIKLFSENKKFDIILMDIRLPGANGWEVTQQIRLLNNDVVIIAQTAYATTEDKQKCLSEGFNDYLSKPIMPSVLLNTLSKYLD